MWIIIIIIAIIILVGIIITLISLAIRTVTAPTPIVPTPTPTPVILTTTPTPTPTPFPTPLPDVIVVTPTPAQTTFILTKVFAGPGFNLSYPVTWGLLTCSNSQNFEFDPVSGVDQLGVVCTVAQKPITVILDNNLSGCGGTTLNIGSISVLKSTSITPSYAQHQWCTNTSPVLKITHRVGTTTLPTVSSIDYSSEVEAIISTLRFVTIV